MIRRSTLFTSLLAVLTGIALFVVKYQVQDFEGTLTKINREISDHRQAVHVLKAEWSHLNNPERLGNLARWHLGMQPIDPAQMTNFKSMERLKLSPRLETKVNSGVVVLATSNDGQAKP